MKASSAFAGQRAGEAGYTLVALLAAMTILMLMISAAAPSMQQQAQREREAEAIFRGEQVAEAIRQYVRANRGALPTSMEQLLEGVPSGTRKRIILRPSAAIDPLTGGPWRPVRPNDPALLQFQQAVTLYAGGALPPTNDRFLQQYAAKMVNILNTGTADAEAGSAAEEISDDGDDSAAEITGPFIGVRSRSHRPSIINYYGIDRHDRWVFTPLFR
jgi:type II secretory pathway pseudopilin PulG